MFDIKPVTSDKPTDCGATCLKMLLSYYDQDVDLDQLIEECSTKITGCTAKDLMVAGRLHGLDMRAFNTDIEGILEADRPAIIWWKYGHWVVFCGLDDDGKVVICNPDRGRYPMSKGIFKMFYTDIALFNGEPQDMPGIPK